MGYPSLERENRIVLEVLVCLLTTIKARLIVFFLGQFREDFFLDSGWV
jgi:hypothetical protein